MSVETKAGALPAVDETPTIEEGFKAKSIGIISYLFVIMYFMMSMTGPDSMNLVLPAVEKTFGWAPPEIAVKLGVVRLIAIVTMFLIGTFFIKVGVKKILVPCMMAFGLCTIAMAHVTSMQQFVWINIVIGAVAPAAMVAMGALTANWFVRTRGRVLGIITIAFPLTTATFTAIGTKSIDMFGYQGFYTAVGIIVTLVAVAGIKLIIDKPEDVGLSPDGIPFTEKEQAEIKERESFQSAWTLLRILKTKDLWAYTFAWALIGLVLGSVMSQIIPVLTASGIGINKALGMMSAAAVCGIPLSYVWGWLDDKIGTPKTTVIFTSVLITGAIGMAYGSADNTSVFYLAILCVALGSAGLPNLQPSSLAYMVGRREFVNVQRYFNIVSSIFVSISMAYVPVMHAMFGSYKPVFLSLIIFIVLALVLLQFAKRTFDPERQEFIDEGQSH